MSTNLKSSGKWHFLKILSFHICLITGLQMSDVSLSTLAGMLFDAIAFLVLRLQISFSISFKFTSSVSKRTVKQNFSVIAIILG